MLSFIIWLPIATAFALFISGIRETRVARLIALLPLVINLALSLHIFCGSPSGQTSLAFEENMVWESNLGIHYHLGVNSLGATLLLLTSLVGIAAVGLSNVSKNPHQFFSMGLIMIGGMAGAFVSQDLFFFYIFHEFALIPTFILIGVWGAERRRQAAMKIAMYLGLGSLILLVGLLDLYICTGAKTFDFIQIKSFLATNPLTNSQQIRIFGLLFFGFGILISLAPFHTWAPIGYGEAPALASMLHAGVIKKFGLYGLIAVAAPLLPAGMDYWRTPIAWFAVGNLVYCGYVAMHQKDLRYMLAYSSVSHMGYAFLAFAALGNDNALALQGLILFIFAHGLSAAIGFGIAAHCRDQLGTSLFADMGGLARKLPFCATLFTMVAFAGSGLPGFANFPAELLIFFGSIQVYPIQTILAIWTVVISAVYFLRAVRSTWFGPPSSKSSSIVDMNFLQKLCLCLLLAFLMIVGFWPRALIGTFSIETSSIAAISHD
jgi:NADH-quinone oxidoreductase subunit M